MYFPQVWFNLADESLEENIYDRYAMRRFMRLDYFKEDATTLPRFRHPHKEHDPRKEPLRTLNGIPEKNGKITRGGSISDATIIEAPSPAKNSAEIRDPGMKPAQKGNQRHFGMKARIGVDASTGMVRGAEVTAANVHDLEAAHKLIRPDDDFINEDPGYTDI
jgi:IS5 family transposase